MLNKTKKSKNNRKYNADKFNKFKEKKQLEEKTIQDQRIERSNKIRQFKNHKKELRVIVSNSVSIDYSGDIYGKFTYNLTDSNYINKHILNLYERCKTIDKSENSNLGSKERRVSKYSILKNTTLFDISNKQDMYNIVQNYIESL
mgnify:CR=1 FL=1